MAVPELSFAQLRARWQSLLESRFCQEDFVEFIIGVRTDLPVGSFMRQVAEVMVAELDPDIPVQPLVMEDITTWPMTTRIDGIMPLKIPVSNDVVLPIYRFLDDMEVVGFDRAEPDCEVQVICEFSLCLLAWLHQRPLQSNYGMMIELTTQCPSSAMAAKEDLSVMGCLPNGGRVTVFITSLKAELWTCLPPASIEHLGHLKAARNESGHLLLVKDDPPERPQRLRW
ncbi:hypothetical protein OAN94_02835 [Verrucomicrobiales bacterium]|jgi:hypothetical protein|nr:hypothetical protein [Verrucomicrobiales bacterium]MDC0503187.1 hypothetical protein [Verrucomicrobiales bacterium]